MKTLKKLNLWQVGIASLIMLFGSSAFAATNQATDNSSPNVSLTSSGIITVNSTTLAIAKEARDLSGNLWTSPVTAPSGTQFYFILYIDNITSIDLTDVRFVDAVDTTGTGFTVDGASFQAVTLEMTAANDANWAGSASWNGLAWAAQTAATGDDELDWNVNVANQVTIGTAGTNAQLDIVKTTQPNPATDPNRYAVRFKVTMN